MNESLKNLSSPVGYISLVDFLHQHNINDETARKNFDSVSNNDVVSDFLNDSFVIKAFAGEAVDNPDYQELVQEIETYKQKYGIDKLSNPLTQRNFIKEYRTTHKSLDILANKQHSGNRITATVAELVQNAIDATATAKDSNITPIGKFGMGAKTMFGSMSKGDYLLVQSKDKTICILKTGEYLDSLVISQEKRFITAQIGTIPEHEENTTVTLKYNNIPDDDSILCGIEKFRYNPNVAITLDGKLVNELEQTRLETDGLVSVETLDGKITIKDQGEGFDPLVLLGSSSKNSQERYSKGFLEDSYAHINPKEIKDLVMLIQDTVVTGEIINNKERYLENSLTNGIVVENKNYLQTSESRSDWSCNDMTAPSLELAFSSLIDHSPIEDQTVIINTLYLWYNQLPNYKQLSLSNIKSLLLTKTKEIKNNNPNRNYLPNLREFGQFATPNTIFLHPDLIGGYNPEKIPDAKFLKSVNGFALWSLPLEINKTIDVPEFQAIGRGEKVESLGFSNVIKLEKSIPPQIWINSQVLEIIETIENNPTPELIEKYNKIVWLLNVELNEIYTGYKAVKAPYNYYPSYQEILKTKKLAEVKSNLGQSKEIVGELNKQYQLKDTEYLSVVAKILEKGQEEVKKTEIEISIFVSKTTHLKTIFITYKDNIIEINISQNNHITLQKNSELIEFNLSKELINFLNYASEKDYSKTIDLQAFEKLIDSILSNNEDKTNQFQQLIEIITEQESEKEKPIRQICKVEIDNQSEIKTLKIKYGKESINFSLNNNQVMVNNPKYETHTLTSDSITDILKILINNNANNNQYFSIEPTKLEIFNRQLGKAEIESLPIAGKVVNLLYDIINSDNRLSQKLIEAKSENEEGVDYKVFEFQNMGYTFSFIFDQGKCQFFVEDKEGKKIFEQNMTSRILKMGYDLKINEELGRKDFIELNFDQIIKQKEYFKPSMSFQNFVDDTVIKILNNETESILPLPLAVEVISQDYSIPEIRESEFKTHKSVDGSIHLQGAKYQIILEEDENEGSIEIIQLSDNSPIMFKRIEKLNLDHLKNEDKIDLDSISDQLDTIQEGLEQGINEYEYNVSIVSLILAKLKQNNLEQQTSEKQPVTKENLEEYAKTASTIEQILIAVDPYHEGNILSKNLKEIKSKERLSSYQGNYTTLVEFINSYNPDYREGLKVIASGLSEIGVRLAQNNYGNISIVDNLAYFANHPKPLEILRQSHNLIPEVKTSILYSILLGGTKVEQKEPEIISIITNLNQIKSDLSESQKADFEDLLISIEPEHIDDNLVVTDNLVKIKNDNPIFFDYLIKRLTLKNSVQITLAKEIFGNPLRIEAQDQLLYKFLKMPNAVLLAENTIPIMEDDKELTIKLNNLSLGELAIASRSVLKPKDLKDGCLELTTNSIKQAKKSDIEINRLATSQVSGDPIVVVIRELLQNSKDAGNQLGRIREKAYLKDPINQTQSLEQQQIEIKNLKAFTIALDQDIYVPQETDIFLEKDTKYLRTVFRDDATGIPDFLFNYFNPTKSTKDMEDALSAGAFGCGAITINSIADSYEIATQNIGEEKGFLIKVKVTKSLDNTQVIKTEVCELSRIENRDHGTEIRIYTKEREQSQPFEVQAMIANQSCITQVGLEAYNNPNLTMVIQQENLKKPEFTEEYNSTKVQFLKGPEKGYYVKNIFVNQELTTPLPKMIQEMLKDNPLAINFHNKLELVRTRSGFTQDGEKEVMDILIGEYLTYIANQIFNGSTINIPEMDTNLSHSYKNYRTELNVDDLIELSQVQLSNLSNRQLIGIILQIPIIKDGEATTLNQMLEVSDRLAQLIRKNYDNLGDSQTFNKKRDEIFQTMTKEEKRIYRLLEGSKVSNTYRASDLYSSVNTNMSPRQKLANEKIVILRDLDQETLTKTQKAREVFDKIFKTLTKNLKRNKYDNTITKYQYDFVTRTGGTDYEGSLLGDTMYYKFDFKNILELAKNPNPSPSEYKKALDVIFHEVAHTLERLGSRIEGSHDTIFQEFMRINYSKFLQEVIDS